MTTLNHAIVSIALVRVTVLGLIWPSARPNWMAGQKKDRAAPARR